MKTSRAVLTAIVLGLALGVVSLSASADGYRGGGGGYYRGGGGSGYYRGGYGGHYGHYRGYYGGPRVSFGFYGPWWGPGYWGPGYWGPGYGYGYGWGGYVPPVAVVPAEPQVYVERDGGGASGGQWWYWCASAKGYYPYVSACSEGWQRVAPQPSQAPQ